MTVRVFKDGDIATSGTQFIGDIPEVAQVIKSRLALYLGEYFRDINDGTRWYEDILGKAPTLNSRLAELKRRIATTQNVARITAFNADFDQASRIMSVTSEVETTGGESVTVKFGSAG